MRKRASSEPFLAFQAVIQRFNSRAELTRRKSAAPGSTESSIYPNANGGNTFIGGRRAFPGPISRVADRVAQAVECRNCGLQYQ